jgi:hypothetical protein
MLSLWCSKQLEEAVRIRYCVKISKVSIVTVLIPKYIRAEVTLGSTAMN